MKGCRNSDRLYATADAEVKQIVGQVNEGITVLNSQYNRNTLMFNADLLKTRGVNRNSKGARRHWTHGRSKVMWHWLYDGIHPGPALAALWLMKLHLDIIKECYADPHMLQVTVDAQDMGEMLSTQKDLLTSH